MATIIVDWALPRLGFASIGMRYVSIGDVCVRECACRSVCIETDAISRNIYVSPTLIAVISVMSGRDAIRQHNRTCSNMLEHANWALCRRAMRYVHVWTVSVLSHLEQPV